MAASDIMVAGLALLNTVGLFAAAFAERRGRLMPRPAMAFAPVPVVQNDTWWPGDPLERQARADVSMNRGAAS